MKVEVVSPDEVVFSGEATEVVTKTTEGEIAFMANHAPFLGSLVECQTRVYLTDGTIKEFAVTGGFVEVSNSQVSILSA